VRTLLKVLGILLLVPLCVLFMTVAQLLALEHAVASSFGSHAAFQAEFDESFRPSDLAKLAAGLADLLRSDGKDAGDGKDDTDVKIDIDPTWFATNARTMVLGMHAYFTGASEHLPSIEVGPLLDSLETAAVESILLGAGADLDKALSTVSKALKKLPGGGLKDGEPTAKALALVAGSPQMKELGLSDASTLAIAKVLLAPVDPEAAESLARQVVRIVVEDRLKLSDAADTLSFDRLLVDLYGTTDNVVMVGRDKALDLARVATVGLVVLLGLLVLLIGLLSFSPRTTPLWLGIPLILTGGGTVLTALLDGLAKTGISRAIQDAMPSGSMPVQTFVVGLFDRMNRTLLIDGALMVLAGVLRRRAAAAAAQATPATYGPGVDAPEDPRRKAENRYWLLLLGRAVAVAMLVLAMNLTVRSLVAQVRADVDAIEAAVSVPKTENLFEVLDETLGSHFAELMPQPSGSPAPKTTQEAP